jgi:hypothetical protein
MYMQPVSQQDQLAQVEATIGRLPPGVRIILSARDFQIIEIQLSSTPAMVQRVCVLFDTDRDLRVLWVLGALAMFDRGACSMLVALAESKGKLRSWWTKHTPMLAAVGVRPLKHAANVALAPDDRWEVEPPVFVNLKPDGTADLDALTKDDLLRRTALPKSMALGRVSS